MDSRYGVCWGREDDLTGYYPKDHPANDWPMNTPWRVRKIMDQSGKIDHWAVAKIETDEDGNERYTYDQRYERVKDAKQDAAARIVSEYEAERKAERERAEAERKAEYAVADPLLAGIKAWIADNSEAIAENKVEVTLGDDDGEGESADSAESLRWWSYATCNVELRSEDNYLEVRVPHPHKTESQWDDDDKRYDAPVPVEIYQYRSYRNQYSVNSAREFVALLTLAASLAEYCEDMAAMVREEHPVPVEDEAAA